MERNGDFTGSVCGGLVFIFTGNFRSYYYPEIPAAPAGLDVEALALAIPHLQESRCIPHCLYLRMSGLIYFMSLLKPGSKLTYLALCTTRSLQVGLGFASCFMAFLKN